MSETKKVNNKSLKSIISRHPTELLLLGILLALFLVLGATSPVFLKTTTLMKLLKQASIYGIIAIGMVLVITSSGIDLSVGSVVGLSGVVVAMCINAGMPIPLAILVALIASMMVGIFNGVLVYDFKVPPFIATMGTMTIIRNLVLLITGAKQISKLPDGFKILASGDLFGIPFLFLAWLCVILTGLFITKNTVFGRNIYAYGSNKEAARLSGINVRKTLYGTYATAAIFCGIAGVLLTSRLGSGVPTSGSGYELDAIAAAVVGGASLDGGVGSVMGTVLGAMLMATLRQGGTLLGINSFIMEIVIGSLIVIAVVIDKMRKK